jgi:hypothetical protein
MLASLAGDREHACAFVFEVINVACFVTFFCPYSSVNSTRADQIEIVTQESSDLGWSSKAGAVRLHGQPANEMQHPWRNGMTLKLTS